MTALFRRTFIGILLLCPVTLAIVHSIQQRAQAGPPDRAATEGSEPAGLDPLGIYSRSVQVTDDVTPLATADASHSPPADAADVPDGPYYYLDQALPLTLQHDKLAVFVAQDGGVADVGAALEKLGVTATELTPHTVSGWTVVGIPGSMSTEGGVRKLAAQLAADETVDFVSPIFHDALGPLLITQDILFRFHPDVAAADHAAVLDAAQAGVILDVDWAKLSGAYRLSALSHNGFEVLEAANALAELPEVKWAEPDMIFTGELHSGPGPNDPFFDELWGIHNTGQTGGTPDMDMDGLEAWDITLGVGAIQVAILDNGTEYWHADLNAQAGTDTTTDSSTDGSPVNSCDNHGTAVAGVVTAIRNNGIGVAGIAPSCIVRPTRVFISNVPCDGFGQVGSSWVVNALDWAEDNGVRVTNTSLGFGSSNSVADKFASTLANGMVHFAAAGNDGSTTIGFPANLPSVLAVAALDHNGILADFAGGCWNANATSTSGPGLFISAPGEDIYTTDRTGSGGYSAGDYICIDGTSFASPYAAGVAALVLSTDASLTPAEVGTRLAATAMDLGANGYDTTYGYGFINAHMAVLNDCCSAHGTAGCNSSACELCVCTFDEYCCETAWDDLCAECASGTGGVEACAELKEGACAAFCEDCDVCGNDWCGQNETCATCPQDCTDDCEVCGNGTCGDGESCSNCAEDCGVCPETCEGFCGGHSTGGCYCDDACNDLGDCCPDACIECPELNGCGCPLILQRRLVMAYPFGTRATRRF